MPIYVFKCKTCKEEKEVPSSGLPLQCSSCGGEMRRKFTAPAIIIH